MRIVKSIVQKRQGFELQQNRAAILPLPSGEGRGEGQRVSNHSNGSSCPEWIELLPTLGAGLGYREPFKSELFRHQNAADFLEITADHFFDPTPEKERELELLSEHFTLIPHGLNLSLGSAEGLDDEYVGKFAELVERLNPPWWSEHVAFTRAGGVEIGHLAPLPFTHEAVDVLSENIAKARGIIGPNLILENITFNVLLPGAELSEAEFLREVLEQTDCGLLLDVTNLHINCVNHGWNSTEILGRLPLNRVVQLHFSGGHEPPHPPIAFLEGGVGGRVRSIDSHSQPAPEAVWTLLDEVLRRAAVKGVILERDDNLPPFAELRDEVARARKIGQIHHRWN